MKTSFADMNTFSEISLMHRGFLERFRFILKRNCFVLNMSHLGHKRNHFISNLFHFKMILYWTEIIIWGNSWSLQIVLLRFPGTLQSLYSRDGSSSLMHLSGSRSLYLLPSTKTVRNICKLFFWWCGQAIFHGKVTHLRLTNRNKLWSLFCTTQTA